MLQLRPSTERGSADHGWLLAKHSFSFANYYDPNHMGFRCLRVINEDRVQPSKGFGTHGHRDMEIITYIIEGELEHKDSMGTIGRIKPGEVQYMCAGTGVRHSEYNASASELVHLLQIWILPNARNHKPNYQQADFSEERNNHLQLVVDGTGTGKAIQINQDIKLFSSILDQDKKADYQFATNRYGWIQIVKGELLLQTKTESILLKAGDGLAISDEKEIQWQAKSKTEFLLFDLP